MLQYLFNINCFSYQKTIFQRYWNTLYVYNCRVCCILLQLIDQHGNAWRSAGVRWGVGVVMVVGGRRGFLPIINQSLYSNPSFTYIQRMEILKGKSRWRFPAFLLKTCFFFGRWGSSYFFFLILGRFSLQTFFFHKFPPKEHYVSFIYIQEHYVSFLTCFFLYSYYSFSFFIFPCTGFPMTLARSDPATSSVIISTWKMTNEINS